MLSSSANGHADLASLAGRDRAIQGEATEEVVTIRNASYQSPGGRESLRDGVTKTRKHRQHGAFPAETAEQSQLLPIMMKKLSNRKGSCDLMPADGGLCPCFSDSYIIHLPFLALVFCSSLYISLFLVPSNFLSFHPLNRACG